MEKLTWEQFKEIMEKANKEKNSIRGVIVFKPESFDKEFSEESRSYEVGSDNKYWNPMMGGSSLFGYCLDGTDQGARLDWYMHAIPEDNLGKRWLIDYCYLLDDVKEEKTESIKTEDIKPDREYKGIKYFDNKDGWCPVCNKQLSYGVVEHIDGDMEYYPWECEKCGAKGEAWFKEVFQGHTVYDKNDDGIDLPFNESKEIKTEATDLYTNKTNLEKGFADEVIFHLESLANDGIEEAKPILDDSDKVNEIVQELINGCDDIWESIHLKIEELAGINFRDKISESKEIKTEAKLTDSDIKYLKEIGHLDDDIPQIEDALNKTVYKVANVEKDIDGKVVIPDDEDDKIITAQEAREILGDEIFLSGLSRSAFHFTSGRYNNDETKYVSFDSSKLFEESKKFNENKFKVNTPFGDINVEAKDEEEAEAKVKEAFRDGYKEKVKVIKEESLASDAAQRINQNDRYEGKECQTEEGMLATKIAMVAEYLGDDYSEWLGDQEVKELIEEIKASDEYQNLNIKLNELIDELVQDKVDYIRKDEPASRYYTGEEELDENKKLSEDYTQASNAGAIKIDVMGQPTKKKNKDDKEDPIIKSLPAQQVLIEGKEESEYEEVEEKIEKEMYEYLDDMGIDLLDEELEFTEALKNKVEDLLIEFHTDIISEYMARYDENLMFDCDVTSDGKINVNVWSF